MPLIRKRPHGSTSDSRPAACPCGVTRVIVVPDAWSSSRCSLAAIRPHQWNRPSMGSKCPRSRTSTCASAMTAGPSYSSSGLVRHHASLPRRRLRRPRRVDAYAVLARDPLEGVPDERAQVSGDRRLAHRPAAQPPFAGGETEPEKAVRPRLGPRCVHADLRQTVVEGAREGGRHHLLAVGEGVQVVRVLHEQEEDVRVPRDQSEVLRARTLHAFSQRPVAGHGRDDGVHDLVGAPVADSTVEVVLVGEVAVEHRLADAGRRRDLRNARRRPVLVNRRDRGFDQLGATALAMAVPACVAAVVCRSSSRGGVLDEARHVSHSSNNRY